MDRFTYSSSSSSCFLQNLLFGPLPTSEKSPVVVAEISNASTVPDSPPPHKDSSPPSVVQKRHVCENCGYTTSRTGDMKKHRRIHEGIKPYTCSTCGRSFTQSSHLRVHSRVHAKEN